MDKDLKCQYFERLIANNGSDTYFIENYLHGGGNELCEKFWSENSSSRLCFDLYSWICKVDGIKGFQFEKHLPGVKTGRKPVGPNMDVFFQKDENLIYIESKYTERDSWKYKIDKNNNGFHLSEAYWKDGGYKSCKMNIGERFYNHPEIAELFSNFCDEIQNEINDRKKNEHDRFSWFDPKQETCHLFGIIFDVKNNKIMNKKIFLCNNVYEIKESYDIFEIDNSIVWAFKNKAESMMNVIFKDINCTFTFEVNTIQDILNNGFKGLNFSNARLFAMEEKNVKDFINENYKYYKR